MLKINKKILVVISIFMIICFTNINMVYAIVPQQGSQYQGIDVSNWQGYIDYRSSKTRWNRYCIHKSEPRIKY